MAKAISFSYPIYNIFKWLLKSQAVATTSIAMPNGNDLNFHRSIEATEFKLTLTRQNLPQRHLGLSKPNHRDLSSALQN